MTCQDYQNILVQQYRLLVTNSAFLFNISFVVICIFLGLLFFHKRQIRSAQLSLVIIGTTLLTSLWLLYNQIFLNRTLALDDFSVLVIFILFPIWYVGYFIRSNDQPKLAKIIPALVYLLIVPVIFYFGYNWYLEQIIFAGKFCLGISCSICH